MAARLESACTDRFLQNQPLSYGMTVALPCLAGKERPIFESLKDRSLRVAIR